MEAIPTFMRSLMPYMAAMLGFVLALAPILRISSSRGNLGIDGGRATVARTTADTFYGNGRSSQHQITQTQTLNNNRPERRRHHHHQQQQQQHHSSSSSSSNNIQSLARTASAWQWIRETGRWLLWWRGVRRRRRGWRVDRW
eukprot:693353-Rhodomonas_salina.2